ncbi:hypothetical protein [Flavonifractor sp. An100]|uniref:hypothetical protein n=1 Tax=Flavonifractor sp. An100 TaxID=1965538 RepID=UPI000B3A29BE|nr:hypothetical protein [Flavonifractor sp. An100]OUQ82427.1 hypothetical protein B5E43_01230 [Flavonifractor sp. An100]
MPSINEIIERVGQLRPDAYDDSSKAGWLIELDGKIYREVILRHRLTPGVEAHGPVGVCPECGSSEIFYDSGMDCSSCQACRWSELPKLVRSYPEDGDVPLLVPAPYDNLYSLYLMAQIDFHNREGENYNNSALAFNQAMDEFKKDYHRTHIPITTGTWSGLF